jgi:hypothetical protein
MNRYFNNLLFSPFLWAIAPTAIALIFISDIGSPYIFNIQPGLVSSGDQVYYQDLNNDGTTEQIHAKPGEPLNNLPVMTNDGRYYDQWNFPDQFLPGISELTFGDYDDNGLSEIYVFTLRKDSIFLNAFEPFDSSGFRLVRKFITIVNLVDGENNSVIKPIGFFDNDHDTLKEFYFAITTGFGLQPRNCYFLNLGTLKLTVSKNFGVNFNSPSFADLNNDATPEIITSTSSPGNQKTQELFSDKSAWLMALDLNLNFIFPPEEFAGFGGRIDVEPLNGQSENKLLAIYNYNGRNQPKMAPGLRVYSSSGKMNTEKSFSDLGIGESQAVVVTRNDRSEFAVLSNPVYIFNSRLDLVKSVSLPLSSDYTHRLVDLENDGIREIILYSKAEHKLLLCTHEFNVMGSAQLDFPETEWRASVARNSSKPEKICLSSGDHQWHLTLVRNKSYLFRYVIYPAIYFGFAGLIFATRKITTRQVEKREALKKRLLQLQLQSIKSQLDPHFTFNVLNSISSLLYLDDRKTAYDALNIFTRLLRQLLADADKIYRPLGEEISFVANYLVLEKIRFSNFDYRIEVSDALSGNELVPKMAFQIFAENSLKHGLVPKGSGGLLIITASKQHNTLLLTIEDNGIGRKQSAKLNAEQGKGLKINHGFYDTLTQLTGKIIESKITDLYDVDGNASGTKVEVRIPLDLSL